ncbi:glycosyl transferase family 8, partial [Brachyspira aalborgi]
GNITYEENAKKRKQIDKIVWFIPTFKLRDKVRRYLLKKIGLTGR